MFRPYSLTIEANSVYLAELKKLFFPSVIHLKYTGNSDVETDTIGNVKQQIHEAEAEAQSELSAKIDSINLILETILPYLVSETGTCGDDAVYSICDDGTVHIAGGDISPQALAQRDDFSSADISISGKIGVCALAGCTALLADCQCVHESCYRLLFPEQRILCDPEYSLG